MAPHQLRRASPLSLFSSTRRSSSAPYRHLLRAAGMAEIVRDRVTKVSGRLAVDR
jgi:hypothetical protein